MLATMMPRDFYVIKIGDTNNMLRSEAFVLQFCDFICCFIEEAGLKIGVKYSLYFATREEAKEQVIKKIVTVPPPILVVVDDFDAKTIDWQLAHHVGSLYFTGYAVLNSTQPALKARCKAFAAAMERLDMEKNEKSGGKLPASQSNLDISIANSPKAAGATCECIEALMKKIQKIHVCGYDNIGPELFEFINDFKAKVQKNLDIEAANTEDLRKEKPSRRISLTLRPGGPATKPSHMAVITTKPVNETGIVTKPINETVITAKRTNETAATGTEKDSQLPSPAAIVSQKSPEERRDDDLPLKSPVAAHNEDTVVKSPCIIKQITEVVPIGEDVTSVVNSSKNDSETLQGQMEKTRSVASSTSSYSRDVKKVQASKSLSNSSMPQSTSSQRSISSTVFEIGTNLKEVLHDVHNKSWTMDSLSRNFESNCKQAQNLFGNKRPGSQIESLNKITGMIRNGLKTDRHIHEEEIVKCWAIVVVYHAKLLRVMMTVGKNSIDLTRAIQHPRLYKAIRFSLENPEKYTPNENVHVLLGQVLEGFEKAVEEHELEDFLTSTFLKLHRISVVLAIVYLSHQLAKCASTRGVECHDLESEDDLRRLIATAKEALTADEHTVAEKTGKFFVTWQGTVCAQLPELKDYKLVHFIFKPDLTMSF